MTIKSRNISIVYIILLFLLTTTQCLNTALVETHTGGALSQLLVSLFHTTTDPSSCTTPEVVITAPSIIGICDAPTINVTTSTGACGQDWKSAVLEITSIPLTLTLGNHPVFPPLVLPIGILTPGFDYTLRYTLCNIMDTCDDTMHVLHVRNAILPTVVLYDYGQGSRDFYSADTLHLAADGYTANCDGSQNTTDVEIYTWAVMVDGSFFDSSIVSDSTDPKIFQLSALTLSPLTDYQVIVTGHSIAEGTTSSASVMIHVSQADLVVVTSGDSQQSVPIGERLIIDASESYDPDSPFAGSSALRIEFACMPLFILSSSVYCSDLSVVQLASSVVISPLVTGAAGDVHMINVTVFDAEGLPARRSSQIVTVTTTPSLPTGTPTETPTAVPTVLPTESSTVSLAPSVSPSTSPSLPFYSQSTENDDESVSNIILIAVLVLVGVLIIIAFFIIIVYLINRRKLLPNGSQIEVAGGDPAFGKNNGDMNATYTIEEKNQLQPPVVDVEAVPPPSAPLASLLMIEEAGKHEYHAVTLPDLTCAWNMLHSTTNIVNMPELTTFLNDMGVHEAEHLVDLTSQHWETMKPWVKEIGCMVAVDA